MRAEIALRSRVAVGIDIERVIGTRLQAALASDTAAVVEIDNAVIAPEERTSRADLDAGRGVTVIAAHHAEMPAGVTYRQPILNGREKEPLKTCALGFQE
jgi:hypothetical protein